jgi:hypothetical protein
VNSNHQKFSSHWATSHLRRQGVGNNVLNHSTANKTHSTGKYISDAA